MQSPVLTCPECGTEIPLSETIAAPLIAQAKLESEQKLRTAIDEKQVAEEKLAEERQAIEVAKAGIQAEVAKQLTVKLSEAEKSQRESIRAELQIELAGARERENDANERLKKYQAEIQEALSAKQKAELAAVSAKTEAQKEVQAEIALLREQAQKEAQDAERLKLSEKDKQIERLLNQLDEAKRQAQLGSQ